MKAALLLSAGLIWLAPAAAEEICSTSHLGSTTAAARDGNRRSTRVMLPTVRLQRHDGARVTLPQVVDDGRPVMLNFIYTTCTAICPPMTQIFAEVQGRLGADRERVRMVSVSIDPEQDTPARLRAFAAQFNAGGQWTFLTGPAAASEQVQRAFEVYRPDKMGHTPVTFLRAGPDEPWVRLDGFSQPDDLVRELRAMLARR